MRVVAGSARGRRLKGPPSAAIRPTTDMVREATFNALQSLHCVDGARVVDLFAGTGACGIEALSRGAAAATFVERDRAAITVIRDNLATTRFEAQVISADVLTYLPRAGRFDLAFVDPPYAFDEWASVLQSLDAEIVVCESNRAIDLTDRWELVRSKRYGETEVTIARRMQ